VVPSLGVVFYVQIRQICRNLNPNQDTTERTGALW
jgi:hypothetical protein